MNKLRYLLVLTFISLSILAKADDDITTYINSANHYASSNLKEYKHHLYKRYKIKPYLLEDCYRQCGKNWGNVGLILELAHVTDRRLQDVYKCYGKYKKYGWRYMVQKMGIKQGSHYYEPFYHHLHQCHQSWGYHYDSHHKCHKPHKKHYKYKCDDDDDDDDDDD